MGIKPEFVLINVIKDLNIDLNLECIPPNISNVLNTYHYDRSDQHLYTPEGGYL